MMVCWVMEVIKDAYKWFVLSLTFNEQPLKDNWEEISMIMSMALELIHHGSFRCWNFSCFSSTWTPHKLELWAASHNIISYSKCQIPPNIYAA